MATVSSPCGQCILKPTAFFQQTEWTGYGTKMIELITLVLKLPLNFYFNQGVSLVSNVIDSIKERRSRPLL